MNSSILMHTCITAVCANACTIQRCARKRETARRRRRDPSKACTRSWETEGSRSCTASTSSACSTAAIIACIRLKRTRNGYGQRTSKAGMVRRGTCRGNPASSTPTEAAQLEEPTVRTESVSTCTECCTGSDSGAEGTRPRGTISTGTIDGESYGSGARSGDAGGVAEERRCERSPLGDEGSIAHRRDRECGNVTAYGTYSERNIINYLLKS